MYGFATVADQPQEIRLEIPPEIETGVYANFAYVQSQEHDITIDFCQLLPRPNEADPQRVRVVSRIRIAPSFVGPLLQVISTNAIRREDMLKKAQADPDEPPTE